VRRLAAFVILGACTETFPAELRPVPTDFDASAPSDASPSDASAEDGEADVAAGSTVKGDVQFFENDAGTNQTGIVLAREADFELNGFYEKLPSGPRAFGVTGPWSLADVPAGTYWVLAGYETDGFVPGQAAPSKIEVSGAPGEVVTVGTQYLTRALKIASILPKASSAAVTVVDTEGEDEYRVTLVDFQNKLLYSKSEAPSAATGANLTFAIGVPLTVPLRYRVRVVAMKGGVELTRTEDLAGLFTAQPDDT
jgi:hypothetical protein